MLFKEKLKLLNKEKSIKTVRSEIEFLYNSLTVFPEVKYEDDGYRQSVLGYLTNLKQTLKRLTNRNTIWYRKYPY